MSAASRIVTREAWLAERRALLEREKAFTRERDALSAARRELPMVRVEEMPVFTGPDGETNLLELFAGRSQLLVYHFMFDPAWDEGCKSCSYVCDHLEGTLPHLAVRDTTLVAISRAPSEKLERFKARMGWTFRWLSAGEGAFNYDYHVSFRADELAAVDYNYARRPWRLREAPGLSVFRREGEAVYHTYSTYGRGLDLLMGTYNLLDLTPLGRQEEGDPQGMMWVRHHDRYPSP